MDHLLRTLAAIPPTDRVLDWHASPDRTLTFARLGFDVHACHDDAGVVADVRSALAGEREDAKRCVVQARPSALGHPDAFFDWVVGWRPFEEATGEDDVREALREALRVMKDGAWIYLAVPAIPDDFDPAHDDTGYASDAAMPLRFTPETLTALALESGFVVAEKPASDADDRGPLVRAIFRKVTDATPL